MLNGETSLWRPILAGVPQGSILGLLLFLIYTNDLPNGLRTNVKLFAENTSLFTIVKDKKESANALNNDLSLISKWAFNWKMLFNPDPHKPAQEVLFSRKKKVLIHRVINLSLIFRWRIFGLIKSILVYFLMKNSLLNIILTIRFAKLMKV